MIDATGRYIADPDDDFLESIEDCLLQEMAKFVEFTRYFPDGVSIQTNGNQVTGRSRVCESDRP